MTRPHTLLTALAVGSCLLAGCQAGKPPAAAKPDPVAPVGYPQIATEGNLGDFLYYAKPIVRMQDGSGGNSGGELMKVTVPLRLADDKPVNAQYRFSFLGADGAPVDNEMDWRFMVLPPRLQVFMEATATEPGARDWRLEVRPAK